MTSDERLAARTSVDLLKGLSHSHVLRVHSSWVSEVDNLRGYQPPFALRCYLGLVFFL